MNLTLGVYRGHLNLHVTQTPAGTELIGTVLIFIM